MFNSQLKDYVKIYDQFLDLDFCKKIVSEIEPLNWAQHYFYDSIQNKNIVNENELSISYEDVSSKEELNTRIWHVISQYLLKDMGHMADWIAGWSGYSPCRFNRYDPSTQMKLHCDHIHSLFDGSRKGVPFLSILGALNDDYEGGELIMCGEHVPLKAGQVLVFPSNFLYPHEVKQVKSGVRYSFVSWVW